MNSVRLLHGPVRPARVAGFVLLALFLQTSAAWSKPEVVVPLAFGNQYKLDLVKNGDSEKNHAAAVKGSIRVCGGFEYEFQYTAIPAPGWDVVVPESNPTTVTLAPSTPEGTEKIGKVRFRNQKGEEADVKADVVVTVYSLTRNEFGRVDKPFTASISQSEIEAELKSIIGFEARANEKELYDSIQKELRIMIRKIPDVTPADEQKEANELLSQAVALIERGIPAFRKKVDDAVKDAATTLKTAFDKAGPELRLSGNYSYQCGFRDPGEPGWTMNKPEVVRIKALSGKGSIDLDLPLKLVLSVIVVGAEIPLNVKFHATLTANADFTATEVTEPDPRNVPITTVGATPAVDLTLTGSISEGVGLVVTFGAGITTTFDFRPLKATLEAGKRKKE